MESTMESWDVVVIGGGAAGLSAALVLGRARRRVAVVDAGQPRNALAAHMHRFLSRDGMPPADLLSAGRAEVTGYGVQILNDTVAEITTGFTVRLAGGRTMSTRRILVTTGVTDELPDLPGTRERWGRDLLHCPYCHGWEVRDQPLGVLGTVPGRTTIPGVWAAGNVVDPRAQVITAAGAGSAAAISINADLVHDDIISAGRNHPHPDSTDVRFDASPRSRSGANPPSLVAGRWSLIGPCLTGVAGAVVGLVGPFGIHRRRGFAVFELALPATALGALAGCASGASSPRLGETNLRGEPPRARSDCTRAELPQTSLSRARRTHSIR